MTREKEFKNIEKQIEIQKKRKLKIKNKDHMKEFISKKNYFNSINGFESLFLHSSKPKKIYMNNISFKDIERMYNLDRNIAKFLFREIENIEIELKTRIAYEFAKEYCNSGIDSNLNYQIIDNYAIPSPSSRNNFSDYFYDFDNPKKRHLFFKKHFIKAKLTSVVFNGTINTNTRNGTMYYNLNGSFSGQIDNLKNNVYSGVFSIKDSNAPRNIINHTKSEATSLNIRDL